MFTQDFKVNNPSVTTNRKMTWMQAHAYFNYFSPLSDKDENEKEINTTTCRDPTTPLHPTEKHQLSNTSALKNTTLPSLLLQTNVCGPMIAMPNMPLFKTYQLQKTAVLSQSGFQMKELDPSRNTQNSQNTSENTSLTLKLSFSSNNYSLSNSGSVYSSSMIMLCKILHATITVPIVSMCHSLQGRVRICHRACWKLYEMKEISEQEDEKY